MALSEVPEHPFWKGNTSMTTFFSPSRTPLAGLAILLLLVALPAPGQAQGPTVAGGGFVAGSRTLFDLNLAAEPLGEFPRRLRLLTGTMSVTLKDGVPMLKASSQSEFLITLPEWLPEGFTVEFDLVPKGCCNPEDLAFEGTRAINQGTASARIAWDSDGLQVVTGGGEMYQAPTPEDLAVSLPGVLTQVAVRFVGTTVTMFTNGRQLYTLSDRRFVRGKVLRVFLGGQDDADQAVYLAGLRIATDEAPVQIATGGFAPGSRTLFELDLTADSLGEFPKSLRALRGNMAVVLKDQLRMLKASNVSEFLVPLPEVLPQDFTLEFELIPKECCNPQDLSFEGTPAINQGDASAHIHWDPDALRIYGGGESYDSPVPEGLALTLPLALTQVNVSVDGGTVKLYTNGRRLYTMSDRKFARTKVLRVFLGGQDDGDYSVHLARLRIATNAPPR